MVSYDTKDWLGAFKLRPGDTFTRLLPISIGLCFYTGAVVFLEKEFLQLSDSSPARNITTAHSLIGFALSMLLVFRTNTAYDRWWEGRRLWGSLVNNSRNLSLKLSVSLRGSEHTEEKAFFASAIPTFAVEMARHLRSDATKFEMDERPHPEIPDFDTAKHVPAQAAALVVGRIYELHRRGALRPEELLMMNEEARSFMDICGACERIRNTPIPYSYSTFIKKFILVFVLTLPFGFAFSLGYLSVPVVAFIFYVLASLEIIAEEIEEPFGLDHNDLPMDRLCKTIEKTVREILSA